MQSSPEEICLRLQSSLLQAGLFNSNDGLTRTWRISPEPWLLSPSDIAFFSDLGNHLLKFYQGLNHLYFDSLKGKIPPWFAEYLDLGKPSDLLDYGRMNRFKALVPGVLRPDVIITEDGFSITELDSVPGGFGNLAHLMMSYAEVGHRVVGMDRGGIPEMFWQMVENRAGQKNPTLALIVSEEANDYLTEMRHIVNLLKDKNLPAYLVRPEKVIYKEDGLFLNLPNGGETQIDIIYRFFELFDLKNIPKADLLMYANKKGKVKTTPPYKTYLEEKLSLALFRHPALKSYWENELESETFGVLNHLIPNTWILDNQSLPSHAVIPGLTAKGSAVQGWAELFSVTQKEREFAVKVSGFSQFAWGSRGVTIGHDVSSEEWQRVLRERLARFEIEPAILQTFKKGKRVKANYFDFESQQLIPMESRVRLTPYYFVTGKFTELGGILATLCHKDKKKIHGMDEAIMTPCASNF